MRTIGFVYHPILEVLLETFKNVILIVFAPLHVCLIYRRNMDNTPYSLLLFPTVFWNSFLLIRKGSTFLVDIIYNSKVLILKRNKIYKTEFTCVHIYLYKVITHKFKRIRISDMQNKKRRGPITPLGTINSLEVLQQSTDNQIIHPYMSYFDTNNLHSSDRNNLHRIMSNIHMDSPTQVPTPPTHKSNSNMASHLNNVLPKIQESLPRPESIPMGNSYFNAEENRFIHVSSTPPNEEFRSTISPLLLILLIPLFQRCRLQHRRR